MHTESDLRVFFTWCQSRRLAPLSAQCNDLELYLRSGQDVRRTSRQRSRAAYPLMPGSTGPVSTTASYSTRQPYVRRPTAPPESPTLGLTHLQFEAILTAARESPNPYGLALVCLLGLLGLWIFETVGVDWSPPGRSGPAGTVGR